MKRLSIKLRINIYYTAILVIMAGILMSGMLAITDRRMADATEAELVNAVRNGANNLRFDPGDGVNDYEFELESDFSFYVGGVTLVVLDEDGNLMFGQYPEGFDESTPLMSGHSRKTTSGNLDWKVYDMFTRFQEQGVWLRGIYSMSVSDDTMSAAMTAVLIALPVFIVLAALAGMMVTRKAFAPINDIKETARSISGGQDLSIRIPMPDTHDEIYDLTDVMNSMIARLENAFNNEKRFSQDVSHELKTPLAVIMSECEFILDETNDDSLKERMSAVLTQCGRMNGIIVSLLEIGKSGKEGLHMEEVCLQAVAESVAGTLAGQAENAAVRLSVECGETEAYGDAFQLSRLIENLMSNAIKYGKRGGHVWVAAKPAGSTVILTVSDDGIGMDKKNLSKVFNRFFREDRRRDAGGSTGLGLSIAKWIAEQHGGSIGVDSKKDRGTVFTVVLPSGRKTSV